MCGRVQRTPRAKPEGALITLRRRSRPKSFRTDSFRKGIPMGDRKPKKNSSGNADAHRAKTTKNAANRDPLSPKGLDKKGPEKK